MKELIKHNNAINLYYLNLLRIVMLRPYKVILIRGNSVGSNTPIFNVLLLGYF
jgi:hypothetical protein